MKRSEISGMVESEDLRSLGHFREMYSDSESPVELTTVFFLYQFLLYVRVDIICVIHSFLSCQPHRLLLSGHQPASINFDFKSRINVAGHPTALSYTLLQIETNQEIMQ